MSRPIRPSAVPLRVVSSTGNISRTSSPGLGSDHSDFSGASVGPGSISAVGFVAAEPRQIPLLPPSTDITTIYAAYCDCTKELSASLEENRRLKNRILDLTISRSNNPSSSQSQGTVSDSGSTIDTKSKEMRDDIKRLGKYFSLYVNMFVAREAFGKPRPAHSFSLTDPARYDPDNRKTVAVLELYEFVPEKYHSLIALTATGTSTFQNVFVGGAQSGRSSLISTIRHDVAPAIFGLDPAFFATTFRRSDIAEIRALLLGPITATTSSIHSTWPSFMHWEGDTTKITGRFRGEALFKVARAIVFGKLSANTEGGGTGRSDSTYLRLDVRAETTFGFIAFVVIVTRYALSDDQALDGDGLGEITNIEYLNEYHFYKRYLADALAGERNPSSKVWVKRLLEEWDRKVFSRYNAKIDGLDSSAKLANRNVARNEDQIAYDLEQIDLDDNLSGSESSDGESEKEKRPIEDLPSDSSDSDSSDDSNSYLNGPHSQLHGIQYIEEKEARKRQKQKTNTKNTHAENTPAESDPYDIYATDDPEIQTSGAAAPLAVTHSSPVVDAHVVDTVPPLTSKSPDSEANPPIITPPSEIPPTRRRGTRTNKANNNAEPVVVQVQAEAPAPPTRASRSAAKAAAVAAAAAINTVTSMKKGLHPAIPSESGATQTAAVAAVDGTESKAKGKGSKSRSKGSRVVGK